MRWPGTECHQYKFNPDYLHLELRNQLGHPFYTNYKSDTHCLTPCASYFWLFFCCYPYQEKNLTNLAYQPDALSRLWCDSVQDSSYVFTYQHSWWTRRQRKEHVMHHGDCKTLEESTDWKVPHKAGLHLPPKWPVPFLIGEVLHWQNIWDSLGYAQEYSHY